MENKHYVIVDENGYITESWSDGAPVECTAEKIAEQELLLIAQQ